MSLETIWDAVARQAALVTGVKAAYGNGAGGQGATVKPYPEAVVDGPVAVVDYVGTEIENAPLKRLSHSFLIALKVPIGNGGREAAVQELAPMLGRFALAFDQNVRLFGTLASPGQGLVIGSGGFVEETDENGLTLLVQPIAVSVDEYVSQTYGIGPSS